MPMTNTFPCKLFLLGGYDLEMQTIKLLLEGRKDCVVLDKHLRWENAQLSAYEKDLHHYPDYDIYGIELQEDIPLPHHYFRIDHHNDWSGKPSALEQVATILGIALNRYEQLVAANDKGYIPGMLNISATEAEINEIRRKDRSAQGVSEDDELQAEQSINNHLSRHGELLVVKSLTPSFSPICDRLYPYQRLLIYNDSEWMFYGEGKADLVAQYAEEIEGGKIFHGGGDLGYIGTVRNTFSTKEIHQFVEQQKTRYEYHQLS